MFIYLESSKKTVTHFCLCALLVTQTACTSWSNRLVLPTKTVSAQKQGTTTHPAKNNVKKNVPTQKVAIPTQITTLPSVSAHTIIKNDNNLTDLILPTEKLQLNVDKLPLNRFIHLALGEVLKQPFYMDESISKRTEPVTLHVSTPIKAERLLGLMQQALTAFDITLTETPEGLSVLPIKKLSELPPSALPNKSKTLIRLGRVMEIVPLKYAKPSEALRFSRFFMQGSGGLADVNTNERLNAVVIIAEPQRIQQFKAAIQLIDKPSAEGKYIRLVRPAYWEHSELITVLKETLTAQGIKVASETEKLGIRFINVKKLNGIIISSPEKEWLDQSLALISKLDIPSAHKGDIQTFMYFVKNARAEELGEVVGQVYQRMTDHKQITNNSKTDDQQTPTSSRSSHQQASSKTTTKQSGQQKNATKEDVSVSENQAVIIDPRRNVLIFVGTGEEYSQLLPLIESLDTLPRQILIEASIAEVKLDETLNKGIEWHLDKLNIGAVAGSLGTGMVTGSLGYLNAGLGVAASGLTYQLIDKAAGVRALISALATEDKVKILSSPRILVMDGKTARIQVGGQESVVTGEVANSTNTDAAAGIVRSFSFVNTGLMLEVTPTINEGGVVQLKINQDINDVGATPPGGGNPSFIKRQVSTTLVARDGQSILIGGLIRHKKTEGESKVPFLGDIPYLGNLFKVVNTTDNATELVIMMTPYILEGTENSEQLMTEFQHLVW